MSNPLARLSALPFVWAVPMAVAALMPGSAMAQGIYSCVDDKGRKITSDRPIAECMDRAQKQLNPSGTLKRVVPPLPTAKDRDVLEEKEKQDAEKRLQQAEEKRRERALMTRYPNRASHDKERAVALEQATGQGTAAVQQSKELAEQRKSILAELEFYQSTPGKAPPALKRRLDETDSKIATQDAEKNRINKRFDDEQIKLKPQWDAAAAAEAASGSKKP